MLKRERKIKKETDFKYTNDLNVKMYILGKEQHQKAEVLTETVNS
jgi:hypothetical protein